MQELLSIRISCPLGRTGRSLFHFMDSKIQIVMPQTVGQGRRRKGAAVNDDDKFVVFARPLQIINQILNKLH